MPVAAEWPAARSESPGGVAIRSSWPPPLSGHRDRDAGHGGSPAVAGSAPASLRSMAGKPAEWENAGATPGPRRCLSVRFRASQVGDTTQWGTTLTQVLSQLAGGARQDSTSSLCQLDCDSYSDVATSIVLSKALAGLSLGRSPLRAMGKGPGGGGPAVTAS